jgi:hypothetical protein
MKTHRPASPDRLVGHELTIVFDRIAAFFITAGLNRQELVDQLESSISRAISKRSKTKFVRNFRYPIFERAVQTWISDPDYVNRAGRPKPLPRAGRFSLSTLLETAGCTDTTTSAIKLLHSLGAISKNRDGQYSLSERHCNWRPEGEVAYEPQASFLMNAVVAATIAVHRTGYEKKLFWRTCHSDRFPTRKINEYLAFSRRKSESVILELNDWFGQHENTAATDNRARKQRIVGIGLFSYVQPIHAGSPDSRGAKISSASSTDKRHLHSAAHSKNRS